MIRRDDRPNPADYPFLVVGTDRFLSGWGLARGGASVAAWARATQADWAEVERAVSRRSDMSRVRMVYDPDGKYRPKGAEHFHVYVVDQDHPALHGGFHS